MSEDALTVAGYAGAVKGAIRIPAGTPRASCRACNEAIYFVGKMPVTAAAAGKEGLAPTETMDGCGISHFANCPQASRFRKAKS